jgi:ribosomal protein L11 methyltransferase
MKWIEAKVIFNAEDSQLAMDLIANLFHEFGLQGVVIEDIEIDPDEDWGEDAVALPEQNAVIGYFPENDHTGKRCRILEKKLKRLEKEVCLKSRIFYSRMDEADWSESWKSYFWPEKVSANIVIKPTWREYTRIEGEIVLEIDPGMAFGTGIHPTTALCITMMEILLKRGDSFLDVGTGSGILMVAAAKLGAQKIWGIDNDEEAVKIANDNLLQNRIEPKKIKVLAGNLVDGVDQKFNLAAANISSEVILKLLDSITGVLTANGIFICSGLVEKNQTEVVEKMIRVGFEIIEIRTRDDWVAIAGRLAL